MLLSYSNQGEADSDPGLSCGNGRLKSVPLRGGVASREHTLRRRRWRAMTSAHIVTVLSIAHNLKNRQNILRNMRLTVKVKHLLR